MDPNKRPTTNDLINNPWVEMSKTPRILNDKIEAIVDNIIDKYDASRVKQIAVN